MLEIKDLRVNYGGLTALAGVSVSVGAGEFVAVVGANGSGKTTLFKAISGVVPIVAGSLTFAGKPIDRIAPWKRAHLGIAHVPEGRQVFTELSIEDNLFLGTETLRDKKERLRNIDHAYTLFPQLAERRSQPAGILSGGQQQMLAIARGLVSSPRLLMLDEPSMGLAPVIVDEIFETIGQLHKSASLAVLLVEQRAAEALTLCDKGYVLSTGRVVAEGPRDMLLSNDKVRQAYLGA